jgi:hypothetical protein
MLDLPIEWVSRAARALYADTEPEQTSTITEIQP